MKLVPFEKQDEEEVPAPIPGVPAELYGELFRAADWAVLNRPWEGSDSKSFFEFEDEGECWRFCLREGSLCLFQLVRKSSVKTAGEHDRLEVHFIASDFLQGHDYELNVRYAPESWDECELDVIVLRAFAGDGERESVHPNPAQVRLLAEGLQQLRQACEQD